MGAPRNNTEYPQEKYLNPAPEPKISLSRMADAFRTGAWPSRQELHKLLRLCHHPREAVREPALTLLLHPPVSNEPAYYRHLIESCLLDIPRIGQLPPGLIEALLEIVVQLEGIPDAAGMERFFSRLLRNLPKPAVAALLQKSLALETFLPYIPVRSISGLHRRADTRFKPRWRLLRKTVASRTLVPGWSRPTGAELHRLWFSERLRRRHPFRRARWLRIARPLTLPPAPGLAGTPADGSGSGAGCGQQGRFHTAGKVLQGPFSEATRRYWKTLLAWQAEELRAVRTFAEATSRSTRRVTLSWHNASLAAAGGWAYPPLRQNFPTQTLWQEYLREVYRKQREILTAAAQATDLEALWQLWQQRLVVPKIVQAVWEDRAFSTLRSGRYKQRDRETEDIGADWTIVEEIVASGKFGWPEALSPHQRFPLQDVLAWRRDRHRLWAQGLARLAALIDAGQRLLDRGDLTHLVLPWIDKFFISSKRQADLDYLSGLVQWLSRQAVRPLILFWDDTARASAPSLQLALQELRSRGQPCRGIGIFDAHASRRTDASAIIAREHTTATLFALRPWRDTHNPQTLQQLLMHLDYGFFRDYDSSWKDNLCQFYAGTQVFPLLAVQSEREALPAWIAAAGMKVPFGRYVRTYLRSRIVQATGTRPDAFEEAYAWWANLC